MNDDTACRVRRYFVYATIIFLWAVALTTVTELFWACRDAKVYFQVP